VLWGARFDPALGTWGTPAQISSSGIHARPAVAITASRAIVAGEVGSGTAADLRAYPVAVP
jgi:hypothetical protein